MRKFSEKLARELRKNPRQREPDEPGIAWLPIILETYHVFDAGLKIELSAEEAKRGAKIACREGCVACCLRPEVPVTELETLGIVWFVASKLDNESRKRLVGRLLDRDPRAECSFLLDAGCSIYPVRPLACRILHVFGHACLRNEIPVEDRAGDIWKPSRNTGSKAAMVMLEYYGFTRTQDKVAAFNEGFIPGNSYLLSRVKWHKLIRFEK